MLKTRSILTASFSLFIGAWGLPGCSDPDPVHATAVVNPCALTRVVLSDGAAVTPIAIKGLYGPDCKRHGGESWRLQLDGAPGALEVAQGDSITSCSLLLTTLQVSRAPDGARTDFELAPPIPLSMAHSASASAVNQPGPAGARAFYANARILQLPQPSFSNPFMVEVVYAAEPSACDGLSFPPAWYTRHSVSAASSPVTAPNYEIDASGIVSVVDADYVVQSSSSGGVILWLPSSRPQSGEELKILPGDARPDSFEQIDAAYRSAREAIATAGQKRIALPFQRFGLIGSTLPQTRTILVKRTDGASGVPSYEVLRVLFPPPRS